MTADALALITVDPLVCHGQACLKDVSNLR